MQRLINFLKKLKKAQPHSMKFEVAAEMEFEAYADCTLILNIHALRTPDQTVLEEVLEIDPYLKAEELVTAHGEHRFIRMEITQALHLKLNYRAIVDNSFQIIDNNNLPEIPVAQLDPSIFPYLYPSRYCQSDKLFRLAKNKFGDINNPYLQVLSLIDWIHKNVEYLSGSSNTQTSAYDTVTEQAGVCRDFAHLGIALCRALTIPARYFTGYSYKLNPPDFHACFEAYIGGSWLLFDATRLVPLNGLIKIATGRDAADTAIANMFGNVMCTNINVGCSSLEENFQPWFYQEGSNQAISYL
jgi:transglutaminase-like putative cysteine protease